MELEITVFSVQKNLIKEDLTIYNGITAFTWYKMSGA